MPQLKNNPASQSTPHLYKKFNSKHHSNADSQLEMYRSRAYGRVDHPVISKTMFKGYKLSFILYIQGHLLNYAKAAMS